MGDCDINLYDYRHGYTKDYFNISNNNYIAVASSNIGYVGVTE